eukprot:CAMPEP_0172624022 /NCGR_PEP_ID=MMETSP1068-20121228/133366_1 /TAXON_ID=35684 /ORGANISM="Pseudopedinella elastica, Strain CCMP716" /LENGTH=133 /DNA_ID=CAMNT_0013432807 /DNA_START=262 /DNA_END=659 /DNA_ORIENTATION=-
MAPHADEIMVARVVVPASAAGPIIGRHGAHINALKEETGANIRLVRKEESSVPNERMVQIQGTLMACIQVVNVVVARMAEEPEMSRYMNMTTSYSRMLAGQQAQHHLHQAQHQGQHQGHGYSPHGPPHGPPQP